LLLLVLGAIDLGRMFFVKIAITNAAREGANYLAYHKDEIGTSSPAYDIIEAEAESLGIDIITPTEDSVNFEVFFVGCAEEGSCEPEEKVGVEIRKSVDLILGNILAALGLTDGPLTLTSTINMVVQ
jgi:hypothetical protein